MNKKRFPLLIILSCFFIALFVGYIIGLDGSKQNINIEQGKNINFIGAFIAILVRNTFAFLILTSGVLIGKKIIYFFYVINGYVLGLLISKFKSGLAFATILPHGIMEISFFILAGYFLILYIKERNQKYFKYVGVTFIGLVFAAIVESAITPKIVILLYQ